MKHEILATEIVVAPIGAPRRTYGLSLLAFEAEGSTDSVYGQLRAARRIQVKAFGILQYEKEKPSLLLSESPLLLDEHADDGVWYLSMP